MNATLTPFGDRAFLIEVGDVAAAHRLAATIGAARTTGEAPMDMGDPVVGYGNVVVPLDGGTDRTLGRRSAVGAESVEGWLTGLIGRTGNEPRADPASPSAPVTTDHRLVEIPVTFDGPDLSEVAGIVGAGTRGVVELLTGSELSVAFIGFAPGFPYLTGLPSELAAIPRRSTPRPAVPTGSVAVAGGFASVYPGRSPGGWMLLGRTATRLFDPENPPYALLRAGDVVRFSEVAEPGVGPDPDRGSRARLVSHTDRFVEVEDAGLLSLVEEAGRPGVAGLGIPRAGPADPVSMRLANRLVGNHEDTAVVECTLRGPSLRFSDDAHATVVTAGGEGAVVTLDGQTVGAGVVVPVARGQVLTVGEVRGGLRGYLAVGGGFASTPVVGSRSSDVLSGIGSGPLVDGDRIDLGPPTRPHGSLLPPTGPEVRSDDNPLRILAGPHRFPAGWWERLCDQSWMVGTDSNRIGLRLQGEGSLGTGHVTAASTAMVTGAVQVPPDGAPIILMPDHATVGGYPVIGCVIAADLPLCGQLRPGDRVRFVPVDRTAAIDAWERSERQLAERVSGWYPTVAGT